jgi:hypothetical protein
LISNFNLPFFSYLKSLLASAHLTASDLVPPITGSRRFYPIRIKQFHEKKALVFDKWSICEPACACGDRLEVPVYRFLRDAIVRTYGEGYFDELHEVAEAWKNKKDH